MSKQSRGSGTGILPVKSCKGNASLHGHDGRSTVLIRQGAYLPHWTRDGGFYAVAFRLHDSLPAHVVAEWKAEHQRLLNKRTSSVADEKQLQELFSNRVERHLDAGCGACWMRMPAIADIVADALTYFDGVKDLRRGTGCQPVESRYRLLAWCVMPNHVHVVLRPNPGHELKHILHSWRSFTANEANKLLCPTGASWQPEYYDHLIRDEDDLFHAIEYALNNPLAAGLRDWRWVGCADDIVAILDNESGTGILPVKRSEHGQDGRATPHKATVRSTSEGLGYGG